MVIKIYVGAIGDKIFVRAIGDKILCRRYW